MKQIIQYKTVKVHGQEFEVNRAKDYKYAVVEEGNIVVVYEHEPIWDEEEQNWYPKQIGKRISNRITLGYIDDYNGHIRDSLVVIN